MSLKVAHNRIIAIYTQRIKATWEYLEGLDGMQPVPDIQKSLLSIERKYPIRIPEAYVYRDIDKSDDFYARGAVIQKFQNCFESFWSLLETASHIGAPTLRRVFEESEALPVLRRRPKTV